MFRELILGYPYIRTRRLLSKTERLSSGDLLAIQTKFLRDVLRQAVEYIPYYQKVLGFNKYPEEKTPQELISQFPLLDKKLVKNNLSDLTKFSMKKLKAVTGASTGGPLVFYMDRFYTRQAEKAFIFDQWSRVGYVFGDSILNLRGRTPPRGQFVEHDRLFNIYFVSSFDLNINRIVDYMNIINNIRPRFLHGYPSTMYQLAVLIEIEGKKLEYRPKAVFCGSEKLFAFQRKKIEAVFECPIYHWYGHSECLVLGGECEYSKKFHLYPQYGYTELLPTGVKNQDNREIFEIVATGFNNKVMPLIRYRTGDYAIPAPSQDCECGRKYLLLEEIIGREQEFIVDKDGALISSTSFIFGQHYDVFEGLESIKLRQSKQGIVDVVLVKNMRFNETSFSHMKRRIKELLGNRVEVIYSFGEFTEKTAIGKNKLVEQKLDVSSFLCSK